MSDMTIEQVFREYKLVPLGFLREQLGYDWEDDKQNSESWDLYDDFIKDFAVTLKLKKPPSVSNFDLLADEVFARRAMINDFVSFRTFGDDYFEMRCQDPRDAVYFTMMFERANVLDETP